jgi:hypothetical protein
MCGCNNEIILRTADGIEQTIKVAECEVWGWRLPLRRDLSRAAFGFAADELPPAAQVTASREYRFRGMRRGLVRVLEEVLPDERPVEVNIRINGRLTQPVEEASNAAINHR